MIRRKQIGLRLSEEDMTKLTEIMEWAHRVRYAGELRIDRTGVIVHAISKLHREMRQRRADELEKRIVVPKKKR